MLLVFYCTEIIEYNCNTYKTTDVKYFGDLVNIRTIVQCQTLPCNSAGQCLDVVVKLMIIVVERHFLKFILGCKLNPER